MYVFKIGSSGGTTNDKKVFKNLAKLIKKHEQILTKKEK